MRPCRPRPLLAALPLGSFIHTAIARQLARPWHLWPRRHSWRPLWRGRLNACGMMAASGCGCVLLGDSIRIHVHVHVHGVPLHLFDYMQS